MNTWKNNAQAWIEQELQVAAVTLWLGIAGIWAGSTLGAALARAGGL